MREFQDNSDFVYIHDEGAVFSCSSSQFAIIENTYQPLSVGEVRRWTPETQFISSDGYQHSDPFYAMERFDIYLSKIGAYQAAYAAAHPPAVVTLEQAITGTVQRIDAEVNAFIFGHFNLGASLGIIKKHSRLTNKKAVKNQPLTTEEQTQLEACEAVDEWSRQIMVYAYAKIDQVMGCLTVSEVDAITWDFDILFGASGTQHPQPNISVREFLTT